MGRIGRIAAGAITNGQQVKVSYTHTTWSSLRFPVANDNYMQGAAPLLFRPSGIPVELYHPQVPTEAQRQDGHRRQETPWNSP